MPSKAFEGKVCMVSSSFRLAAPQVFANLHSFRREALNTEHPGLRPEEHAEKPSHVSDLRNVGVACVGLFRCMVARSPCWQRAWSERSLCPSIHSLILGLMRPLFRMFITSLWQKLGSPIMPTQTWNVIHECFPWHGKK